MAIEIKQREEQIASLKQGVEKAKQAAADELRTQLELKETSMAIEIKQREEQIASLKQGVEKAKQAAMDEVKTQFESRETALKNEIDQREAQISKLKKEAEEAQLEASRRMRAELENRESVLKGDINVRDLQIERLKQQLEEMKKQLTQSQAELKGEVGEIELFSILTQAFGEDEFRRETRGTAEGDIVQIIRTSTGKIDMPIVYDNKKAATVTMNDIRKAVRYKETHGTNYVLIVSTSLPKYIENGLFGEREGVLLVHRSVVVELARQIRKASIEISRLTKSTKDREVKEARLYTYISGQDFTRSLEGLYNINTKLTDVQNKEEKDHETLWKSRKSLQEELRKSYLEIASGVDSILQEQTAEQMQKPEEASQVQSQSEHQNAPDSDGQVIMVDKPKKRKKSKLDTEQDQDRVVIKTINI
jgi:hypothetical protein